MGPAPRRPHSHGARTASQGQELVWNVPSGRWMQMPDLGREGLSVKAPREHCALSKDASCCGRTVRLALAFPARRGHGEGHGEGPLGQAQEPLRTMPPADFPIRSALTTAHSGHGRGGAGTVRTSSETAFWRSRPRNGPRGGHVLTRRTREHVAFRGTRAFAVRQGCRPEAGGWPGRAGGSRIPPALKVRASPAAGGGLGQGTALRDGL